MATHDDLQDKITVQVISKQVKFPKSKMFGALFSDIENKINSKIKRAQKELAPAVASQLAQKNQYAQWRGIGTLNAIESGALLGSIRIRGGSGTRIVRYTVGTNLQKFYPHWVVYGRGRVTAKNKNYLKFTPKNSGKTFFRKSVNPAKPRDYLSKAHVEFNPQVSSIVKMEVQRVLG